jgi:hypothetical protein
MSSLKAKIIGLIAVVLGSLAVAANVKTIDPGVWSTLRDVPRSLVDTDVPLLVPICVAGIALLVAVMLLRRLRPDATDKAKAPEECKPMVNSQDLLKGLSDLEEEIDRTASSKRQPITNPKSRDPEFISKSSPPRLEKQDFDG